MESRHSGRGDCLQSVFEEVVRVTGSDSESQIFLLESSVGNILES